MGIVVEIPVNTRCHRRNVAALDARLAILVCNDKGLLAVAADALVDNGDKAVSCAVATNAVEQVSHSGRICGDCCKCLHASQGQKHNEEFDAFEVMFVMPHRCMGLNG